MKQSAINLNVPSEDIAESNVIKVAFNKFSPGCRPPSFEAALADPLFNKLLRARAKQLISKVKNMEK